MRSFLKKLEYALHLLLSPLTMQQVSPVRLAFKRIHSLLDSANTVVKPAFFVVLHLQGPSLQWSPQSHLRNASVSGSKTHRHQLFYISSKRTSHKSFLGLIRICPKIPFQAQIFWARGLQARLLRCRCLWPHPTWIRNLWESIFGKYTRLVSRIWTIFVFASAIASFSAHEAQSEKMWTSAWCNFDNSLSIGLTFFKNFFDLQDVERTPRKVSFCWEQIEHPW